MSLDVFSSFDPEAKRRQDAEAALDSFTRMLAEENVVVVRGDFHTASFDVKNRVCRVPNWKNMSHSLEVLFRAHEMGHALYTTQEDFHAWVKTKPDPRMFSYFNIVEDVRIERRIQSQFPGLTRSFNLGYAELMDRDFFGDILERDMIFIDRINTNTKLGEEQYPMTFKNDTERELYARLQFIRTFDDAMSLAEDIYQYAITEEPEVESLTDNSEIPDYEESGESENGGSSQGNSEDQYSEEGETDQGNPEDQDSEDGETDQGNSAEQTNSKGESITDKLFRESEESVLEENSTTPRNDRYANRDMPIILDISEELSDEDINFKQHTSSEIFTFFNEL